MAVKIYRAAYQMGDEDAPRVYFSEWVSGDGREDKAAELLAEVYRSEGDLGEWVEPTIVGWEEKVLEDPALD